jgi:protein O-mannosyl-transferase
MKQFIGLTLLLVLVAVVYGQGLNGGYVFDDLPNIVRNDALAIEDITPRELLAAAFSSDSGRLNRPIAMASFALERHFFGLNPRIMKITNVVIHLINTRLIYALAMVIVQRLKARGQDRQNTRLGIGVQPAIFAFAVAAAWALAPINLTAVLYVVQRMEALATLFMLAVLLAYVTGRVRIESGQLRSGFALVLGGLGIGGLLAVLSKESGVMLPVFALLLEWLLFGFGARGSAVRRGLTWIYITIVLLPAMAALTIVVPGILADPSLPGRPFDLQQRLWTQVHAMWFYIGNILVPSPGALTLYHDAFPLAHRWNEPWSTLPASLGLVALIGGAIALARRAPLVSLGILWFFIPHLLVSSIIPLELVYEHRNHMASIGLFMAVFSVFLSSRFDDALKVARHAAVFGLIALYGLLTFLRAGEWSDSFQLAYFEATRQPDSPRATYELGYVIIQQGAEPGSPEFSLALAQFEHAALLPRAGLIPRASLIIAHWRRGVPVPEDWWENMKEYVRNNPLSAQDISALYSLLQGHDELRLHARDVEKLGGLLAFVREKHPQRSVVITLHANYLLNIAEDFEEGGRALREVTVMTPRAAQAWANLAQHQIAKGEREQAHHSLRRLRELDRHQRLRRQLRHLEDQLSDGEGRSQDRAAAGGGF